MFCEYDRSGSGDGDGNQVDLKGVRIRLSSRVGEIGGTK